jgi:CRP/FNR family transcriptional regulator, cyclic AMP receptor protein
MPFPALKPFSTEVLHTLASSSKTDMYFHRKQTVFSQGGHGDSVYYVESGVVKLSVTSRRGKEAVVSIVEPGDFFGESCITVNQRVRLHTAVALTDLAAVRIERKAMAHVLGENSQVAYAFINYLLQQIATIQRNLASNLLDSSEERLARTLFTLSHLQERQGLPSAALSQQTLAEMIGATRQRVNVLLQRFKNLEFIENPEGGRLRTSRLTIDPDA